MRTPYLLGTFVIVAGLSGALVGCGTAGPPRTAATTTTAADVASPSSDEAAAPIPGALEASQAPDVPGVLACRTKSTADGTTELFLDGTGDSAKGTLRRVAPSGMTYVQVVRAERYKGVLIVDEPSCTDLVTHAAVVARQNGKQYMRLGDAQQPWSACE